MKSRSRQQGVTLLELVVVGVIVGVLAAIAVPIYSSYLQRGYYSEAQSSMAQAAQYMQRIRTEQGNYKPGGALPTLPTNIAQVPNGSVQRYNISLDPTSTGSVFVLKAVPTASMSSTDKCGTLTLDSTGLKQFSDTNGDMKTCWGQ
jgi:type IV pilus assembly protein PilE